MFLMNCQSRHRDACEGSVKMARGFALTLFSLIAAVPPTSRLVALAFLSSPISPKRSTSISPLITRIRGLPQHQYCGVGSVITCATAGGGASEHALGALTRKTVIFKDSSRQGSTRPTDHHANVQNPRSTTLTLLHSSRVDSSRDDGDAIRDQSNLEVVDPESLAQAREAAKNDDYDWFMEFIGESHNDKGTRNSTTAHDGRRARRGVYGDVIDEDVYSDGSGSPPSRIRSPPRDQRVRSPSGQGFQTYRRDPRRGREIRPTAADTAYDYDFDEEFEAEEGRGGWEYDPELMSNRRRVDLDKVRARARMPARRARDAMPARRARAEEGVDKKGEGGEEQAAVVEPEGRDEVDAIKVTVYLVHWEKTIVLVASDRNLLDKDAWKGSIY